MSLFPKLFLDTAEAEGERGKVYPIPDYMPEQIQASHSTDVGLLKSATPVKVKTKRGPPSCIAQYPLSKEAVAGITPIIESLLQQCISEFNIPILPIKKQKMDENGRPCYRFKDHQ